MTAALSPKPRDATARREEFSLRVLSPLVRWVRETRPEADLEAFAAAGDLDVGELDGTPWLSHDQFEGLLAWVRARVDGDDAFKRACTYRFAESYGALAYMIWAMTPRQLYDSVVRTSPLASRVASFTTLSASETRYRVRYETTVRESRLMCLSRIAQWTTGATLWKLPPAEVVEHACVARGDACCDYELRWGVVPRRVAVLGGAVGGAAFGVALAPLAVSSPAGFVTLAALLGGVVGYAFEIARANRANTTTTQRVVDELRQAALAESEARAEIIGLLARQREWSKLLEEQVASRTESLERLVEGFGSTQDQRASAMRSFSHDLRNPLFVVKGGLQLLVQERDALTKTEMDDLVGDLTLSVSRMEELLSALMDEVVEDAERARARVRSVAVAGLADAYSRRLRALVFGREVRTSVFATREAPELLTIDPLKLDRIVDNLLTNAAKYTERGSIVLEVGGTPGHLTLKVSDTGCGIPDEVIASIFEPRVEPRSRPRLPDSRHVGLAGVVGILASVGGRLEVMSKPDVGSTFWVHLPVDAARESRLPPRDSDTFDVRRVVTIRRAQGE